jgi:TolB protein
MSRSLNRRGFLQATVLSSIGWCIAGAGSGQESDRNGPSRGRILFTMQGKTALINADGSGLRYFEFDVPDQATWQPGGFFSDGRRLLFLSMEPRRDGPGKPFAEYYHKTPTHLWVYNFEDESLTEVANKERKAVFYTPQLLLSDERLLVQVVRDEGAQVLNMQLDGTDAREFTRLGEGMPYGFDLSPDGRRVAYHLASPAGYQIWTSDTEGGDRMLVAGHPDHLYFCPQWSPDGQWLAFQDCLYKQDPGHDWSDLCVARPDGSEIRSLTTGQALWFAATYGNPENRGGGSNVPVWTRDGAVLCSYRLPGSKVAWEFQPDRPDVDHFNRDFKPELARGGTEIRRIEPETGETVRVTKSEPPVWDFRQSESPDGGQIVFCRAETGGLPGIWVANADGSGPRALTRDVGEKGADHPQWLPQRV